MSTKPKVYSHLSQSEAAQRMAALTSSERSKIMYLAMHLAERTGWGPDDLLQEAIARVLQGTRKLATEVSVVTGLLNVMKSIVWSLRQSSEGKISAGSLTLQSDDPESGDSEEETAPAGDQPEFAVEAGDVQVLYNHFGDEDEVQLVLMALADGGTREEICGELQIDQTRYATIRRRIRRAYNALCE